MGLFQDVGGKLVQSFLSMDDLVLGQGLIAEGLSQIGLSGRSVVGSVAVTSNVAARTVHAGIQVGAKTAKATATALQGFVPGAKLARSLAERLDKESAAAGEEASKLAVHAVELTGGERPRNPLTREKWFAKSAPRGYSWNELAADTAVGTFGRLATLPLTFGLDSVMQLSATRGGRMIIDSSLKSVDVMLELLPRTHTTLLDTGELREALMAVTTSSGDTSARNVLDLAEAAARFALGDTRKLRAAIEDAIEQMRQLATHDELDDLLPAMPLSANVRNRARSIAEHAPIRFLESLDRGPEGEAPTPGQVLSAMLNDAGNLRVFATEYPVVLSLMGANASLFLSAGMVDVNEIEGYLQAERKAEKPRPWSVTQLEAYVGKAPRGTFHEATVRAAQDVAFTYSSQILGREQALARAERLYGKKVRERLENDVSLDSDILEATAGGEQDIKIRQRIAATTDLDQLARLRDRCEEQLESLRAFVESLYEYPPRQVTERRQVLSTFLSLAHQDLALRGTEDTTRTDRLDAKRGFDTWLEARIA